MVVQPLVGELLRLVLESERNGDNLRVKLDLHLRAAFERRETLLKRRIETVPVYMIVVLVLFFMPAILLVLTGPSFLALLRALYAT
jgi:tight adherence protein C